MDVAAADGRQRRATGCALLVLLNFAAARAPRDAWVAVAEARRAGRRLAPAWRRRCGRVGRRPGRPLSLPAAVAAAAAARRWWWRRGNGGGQDAPNDRS